MSRRLRCLEKGRADMAARPLNPVCKALQALRCSEVTA